MSDDRLFFKLHNGFPEHPKTIELSDKAFRQLVEAWCYCSRNLNDGYLTKSQFLRFFSPKSRGELVAVGFIREEENQYVMHDYLEHQQSAKQVADLRERRRMAGSKGGKAKANGLASAKQMPEQTPSKPLPDTDTDTDIDEKEAKASLSEPERPDVERVISAFSDMLKGNDIKHKPGQTWRNSARLLIDRDGYTPEQILYVARFATADEFWKSNILSLPKLREKFEALKIKAQAQNNPQMQMRPTGSQVRLQAGLELLQRTQAKQQQQQPPIIEIEG